MAVVAVAAELTVAVKGQRQCMLAAAAAAAARGGVRDDDKHGDRMMVT